MKYFALLLLPLLTIFSCKKAQQPDSCENAICTLDFRTVSVAVNDKDGNFVKLDDFYTIRTKTGDTIRHQSASLIIRNNYIVLTDNYKKQLQNQTDIFRFVGILNGAVVVDQPFMISADCCHISKKSGVSEVTIN